MRMRMWIWGVIVEGLWVCFFVEMGIWVFVLFFFSW